jgi:hypothetical protein
MRAQVMRASGLGWVYIALLMLGCAEMHAQSAEMKLQAYLLWGTDDTKPPEGKNYKPVNPEIKNKLRELPLKWTNWFEVNRKDVSVQQGANMEVSISEKCQVTLKRFGVSELEVSLIGKGKEVVKRKQTLPKGEMLVLGGNAPNATAWLVVLKRIE